MPATPGDSANGSLVARAEDAPGLARVWVRPDGTMPPFRSGQFVPVAVQAGSRWVQRSYSIASAPSQTRAFELYIRAVAEGVVSRALLELSIGSPVRLRTPRGAFVPEPRDDEDLLFVASGTGIAPFVSMLRDQSFTAKARSITLVHGARDISSLGYRDFLTVLARGSRGHVAYIETVSRPGNPRGVVGSGRTGRAEDHLADVVAARGLAPDSTAAFICGHPGTGAAAADVLRALGFREAAIRVEAY